MNKAFATKAKRAAKTTAPPPAPEMITWEDAVGEARRLVAESNATVSRNDWRLAELADLVDAKWGELTKFAAAIGMTHCSLKRRRSTYRNWKPILIGDPGLRFSYAVARELEKHPDRERLIKDNPTMTKRMAGVLMKEFRNPEKAHRNPKSEMRQLWKNLVIRVGEALADEALFKVDRQILLDVVDPLMLNELREAGQAWIHLADSLEKLFQEPANEAPFDAVA